MKPLKILGLCGSLRKASYNHQALNVAAQLMPEGMSLHMADLSGVPLYSKDIEDAGLPASVASLRDQIAAADGVLIASPEYNFSVSGVLKNSIDWISRTTPQPLKDKPVAVFSATQGPVGGARHQYELRKILGCLDALVLLKPEVFIGQCHTKFDAQGALTDAPTRKVMGDQMLAFQAWIRRVGSPST